MNNLSHVVRKINRFELKYILSLEQAARFKSVLNDFLVPDEHGNDNGRYALSSLYYDSPDLQCYWEKESGIRYRRKLRIRHYQDGAVFTDVTPVFVEIKQRVDRVTQKRRVILPYKDALRLCNDRRILRHEGSDKEVMHEIYAFLWEYNLRPASIVSYRRQALVGTIYDIDLRVTFDTALTYHLPPFHLHAVRSGLLMLPVDTVVMEIKVNERMPTWLVDLIGVHGLQLQRISKYCRSIEASWDRPAFRLSNLIDESSEEVLATTLSLFNQIRSDVTSPRKPQTRE